LPERGPFIVLEGPDGSGKTTQARLLAEALSGHGLEVVLTREPGGTAAGERIREMLLSNDVKLSPRAELLLFMASRAQLVDEVIAPSLSHGRAVVADRFLMSSVVYQGLAGSIPAGEVESLGRNAIGNVRPDVTIVLDVPVAITMERSKGTDRFESRGDEFMERVRQGFLSLAKRDTNCAVVVNGSRSRDEVAADVLAAAESCLKRRRR